MDQEWYRYHWWWEAVRFFMFWLLAVSLNQEGFPTIFCGNLFFQGTSFRTALPGQGEQARTVSVASRCSGVPNQQLGGKLPVQACAGKSQYSQAVLTLWNTPSFTSISAFMASTHRCVVLISLSCSVCFSFSFLSLISFLHLFSLLLLIQGMLPLCSSSKIAVTTFHYQHSGLSPFLNTEQCYELKHRKKNLVDELSPWTFFCLLCCRKGCLRHENLRIAKCALPGETYTLLAKLHHANT